MITSTANNLYATLHPAALCIKPPIVWALTESADIQAADIRDHELIRCDVWTGLAEKQLFSKSSGDIFDNATE